MGEDGAYGKGSRYTGIKGIRRMVGADPEEIVGIIMDDTHRYTTEMIPSKAMRKLTAIINRSKTGLRRGAVFFQTVCAICHGFDGAQMPSKTETALAAFGDRGYMGYVASNNPWEVLHKIRNGQPGVGMIALRVLNVQDQVDVLAYMQTLVKRVRGR